MKGLTERIHLEEDEKIIKVLRKHWFILFVKILGPVVLLALPFLAFSLIDQVPALAELLDTTESVGAFATFTTALWTLLMWTAIWTAWTDYYLDMWTITNRRVIAIDQQGLFHRRIASFRYERLQDVEVKIHGLIATFLNFGTVEAATAGHDEDMGGFVFKGAPRPREIKALIMRAADARVNARGNDALSSDGV